MPKPKTKLRIYPTPVLPNSPQGWSRDIGGQNLCKVIGLSDRSILELAPINIIVLEDKFRF